MSEETETYVDLKFHTPSGQQKKQRTRNNRPKGSSVLSPVWRLIVGILGIFCLTLLMALGILGAKVFQVSNPPHRDLENHTTGMEITQGWKSLCPELWVQHGKKCYHFSTEYKPWLESQKACSSTGSRLLLIEDKEELDFINPLGNSHWIGLSRDNTYKSWMWGEDTALPTDWFPIEKGFVDGDCAVVRAGKYFSEACEQTKRYICEQPAVLLKSDISAEAGTWNP